MKFFIKVWIVLFLFTSITNGGAVGKCTKIIREGIEYFAKQAPKTLVKSSKDVMVQEIKYFNRQKNDLLQELKVKNKKKRKEKQKERNNKRSISLASWNLHNISVNTNEYKLKRVNEYIRRLSTIQMTDIVFLQELKDSKNNRLLNDDTSSKVDKLKTYQYIPFVSEPLGENRHKERFAILIHPKFLLKMKKLDRKPTIKPIKLKSYKNFKRPPYGVKIGKELLILNVHLGHYGNGIEAISQRKKEAKELKKAITRLMKNHNTKEVIIAGDFNLNESDLKSIFKKPQYKVTTSGNTTNQNNYDHVITTLPVKSDLISSIDRNHVSDHSPIRIKIDIKNKGKIKKQ